MVESKDFYRPVVTPYEFYLALTAGEWTGEYYLDYSRLLPRLAAAADAPRAESSEDEEESECARALLSSTRQLSQNKNSAGGALMNTGDYSIVRSGAEYLARREWTGLEPRFG